MRLFRFTSFALSLASVAAATFAALLALLPLTSCVATPLPDPPSANVSEMSLVEDGAGFVRLRGLPTAIRDGGEALRVTNARLDVRTNIFTAADGSFSTRIDGVLTDRLYLERVRSDADAFLVAVETTGTGDGRVMASMLSDRDMDLSPDEIDCAPDDPAFVAGECTVVCMSDMECVAGQVCVAGVCAPLGCELAEVCGDGLDNDCDGTNDDGC